MQVNPTKSTQAASPLDGMMAEKTAAQSAAEAFAAVLAKAGLNVQAGVSASLQAPASLAPVIEKHQRIEVRDTSRDEARPANDKAVARGRDEDKTTGQERAQEVRPEGKPAAKADKSDRANDERKSVERSDGASEAGDENVEAGGETQVVADQSGDESGEAVAAGTNDKAAMVAAVEEKTAAVIAVMSAQPVAQDPKLTKLSNEQTADAAQTLVTEGDEGEVDAALLQTGRETKAEAGPQTQAKTVINQDDGLEEFEQAVISLRPATANANAAKTAQTGEQAAETQNVANPEADRQAAMLSRIVGERGQVSIESAGKNAQPVSQPSSMLTTGLLAVETQTQEAVAGAEGGFSNGADLGGGMAQNGSGKNANAAQAAMPANAQLGAGVAATAQTQSGGFSAALVGAQAGAGEGGAEIQGVQGAQGSQAASSAQQASNGLAQAQTPQEARAANAAQAAEKPHEVKQPVPAKEIMDQINVQISKAAKEGLDKITVQMRPEALGRVEVQLKLGNDGQLSALIVADKAETLEALKRDASQLEKSLADAGFKTDQGSLQFSLRGEQQGNQQKAEGGKGLNGFERGQALDEASAEETIAQSRPRASSRSGVDISV